MPPTERYRRVNKFELHDLIGEGAMGVVWKAYDTVIRRFIALKLLGPRIGNTADGRARFLREARAAGLLQHPNLVTLYDFGDADGQLYLAMEFVEGRDLSAIIAANEPLGLERKLDIVIELLDGLSYAHQRGVIHRDVKPSNVRVAPDGRVKIMDFGIARLQSADASGSGAIVGTPNYMAPEQVTNGAITPASDLFSVGCLLYELLCYKKPFEGETVHGVLYQVLTTEPKALRTMAPSNPAGLERVVGKAMNKVPQDRYQSARQMMDALVGIRAALSGASDTPPRVAPAGPGAPAPVLRLLMHTSLRWRVATLVALGFVVVALVLAPRVSRTVVLPPPVIASAPPPSPPQPTTLDRLPRGVHAAGGEPRGARASGLGDRGPHPSGGCRRDQERRAVGLLGRNDAPDGGAAAALGRSCTRLKRLPLRRARVPQGQGRGEDAARRSRACARARDARREGHRHPARGRPGGHLARAG